MKKIASSLLIALSCISAKAADGKSLFVSFNDGSKIEFALSTLPEVTFGNDKMTVKSTATTASYELHLHLWYNDRHQAGRNQQQVCLRR